MAGLKYLSWLLTCTSLICFCNCQDSVASVIRRLDQFQEDLIDNKADVIRIEKRVLNIIDVAKISLRAELKENIRELVREAMAEIIQSETLQDMVKSQVVSELQHLKQGYRQMKRQVHHVSRSLKDFKNETTVFHQSVLKEAHVGNLENSSDDCVRDKQKLEVELQKWDVKAANLKKDIELFNETYQSEISQLKTALVVCASSPATQHVNSTPRSPVVTTSVTTPTPEVEKKWILIVPYESNQHRFIKLNIHSNFERFYGHLTLKKVSAVVYTAKTNKLLIALFSPDKIVSSPLDTSHVTVLKEGVFSTGMAVDENLDIVFIAIFKPQFSISRMSTQGKDFTTIIDCSIYTDAPRQITLDTRRKRIYWCNRWKLFTATYDGHGVEILATGSSMYAVTLDLTAGVLYYNNKKKLMKMTVSNNVSTEVTTLKARPSTMILYRGTIYHGSLGSPIIGAVNVTYNTRAYTRHSVAMYGAYSFILCLIP
ncbi:uncharacterized protein [Haliotis cracherodii]|uniref:uncharacterized protein n=1 Tax=Haliotis cracherodii TaxID=6455 RepID=UPI0039E820CA